MDDQLIVTATGILARRIRLLESEKEHMAALLSQIKKTVHTWDQVDRKRWEEIEDDIDAVMEEVGL